MKLPTQFGPYMLLERVSVGGMAEVFKAKDFGVDGFERTVAVKRILPHVAEDEEFIAMFKDEAKIAVQLAHGNIAQIYSLGNESDSFYIALEYVAGRDLRTIFQRGQEQKKPMPVAQACFVVMKACEGLDYAHNKKDKYGRALNIVHRDVSPPNILVSYEGEIKLIDFGVAKAAGRASRTQAGILKGKFGYMSPEQVRGMPLDRRSDVFSVGVVLWEMLTGERLFQGETDFETLEKVRAVDVRRASELNPEVPKELDEIVLKALAREPDERYQSAIELHDQLQALMFAQGMFYSRKDLAAWMRKHYAKEIEQEKEKAGRHGEPPPPPAPGKRKTMMMTPGTVRPPPPPPGSRRTPPPVVAEGRAPASPTAPHRTLAPGGGPGPRATPVAPAGLPRPTAGPQAMAPAAKAQSAAVAVAKTAAPAQDFGWDDDELETRLFDGGQAEEISAVNRASSLAAARKVEAPSPEPVRAMPVAAASQPVAPAIEPPRPVIAPSRQAPAYADAHGHPEELGIDETPIPRKRSAAPWIAVGLVAVVALGFAAKQFVFAPTATAAKTASGSLSLNVTPVDAEVAVDGQPVVGPSPFVVTGLSAGKHRVEVKKAGFLPFERDVEVRAGEPTPLLVPLELGQVTLQLTVQPEGARIVLYGNGQPAELGRGSGAYLVARAAGMGYEIEASADGWMPSRVPLVFTGQPTQPLTLVLQPGGAQPGVPAPAPVAAAVPAVPAPSVAPAPAPTPEPVREPSRRPSSSSRRPRPSAAEPAPSPRPAPAASSGDKSAELRIGSPAGTPPAEVIVDGQSQGRTPAKVRVSPGNHKIKLQWDDGATWSKSVSVSDGEKLVVKGEK